METKLQAASPPRLLLVDDDPLFGRLMQSTAHRLGYVLDFLSSPKDLHRKLIGAYDLVILDYDLGTLTGVQLAKVLFSEVPVLMVSSYKGVQGLTQQSRRMKSKMAFCNKAEGPEKVLASAIKQYTHVRSHQAHPRGGVGSVQT